MDESISTSPSPGGAGPGTAVAEDTAQYVVETEGLTKRYGEFTAVDGLNLRIQQGEIFGLLGPNGAGKTTTILMLMGLTEPTAGSATVCGCNPARKPLDVKRVVGYVPENLGFYGDLTGRQNLHYTARLNGLSDAECNRRTERALEQVGLADAGEKKVGHYSRGMRQRLGFADVLIKQPRLVILDEPTLGIDPDGVHHILDLIVRMSREQGMTILLSSHLLHQVQQVCHRITIFVRGKMIVQGAISDLAESAWPEGEEAVIEVQTAPDRPELAGALITIAGVTSVERSGETFLVKADHDVSQDISRVVADRGARVTNLRRRGYSLEDIYFKYFRGSEQ